MIKLMSLITEIGEKPSSLDNPNFKKWFGSSKVVDKSGNPLIVYHGAGSKFTSFKQMPGKVITAFGSEPVKRTGFFFSGKDNANSFGSHTMDVYLSLQNPADLTKGFVEFDNPLEKKLVDKGWNQKWLEQTDVWELFDGEDGEQFVNALKELGYDGVIFNEPSLKNRLGGLSYVVFDPKQIKSAIDNNGEFSTSTSDITKEHNL